MYKAIADVSDKHLILYNIPSRTGINIQPDTLAALKDYPDIAAVKEAVSNPHPSSFMICKIEGCGVPLPQSIPGNLCSSRKLSEAF